MSGYAHGAVLIPKNECIDPAAVYVILKDDTILVYCFVNRLLSLYRMYNQKTELSAK
jgi:hypothetical protein